MSEYTHKYYPYDPKNFKAPDWRQYRVEDVPDLVNVRNALASHGLKDPWLRNEVWRYNPAFGSTRMNALKAATRGWKLGLFAAITLYTINNYIFPEEQHHHDDHH
ncbi:NADH dehydrogenase [ubiquinone] 1 beta subcomplex subunit 3 [Trinorchestia longiramus]|nr:NADH dehydrogenase [ubiquinone] 1 beta subcomplex subunit 3 [Trinorchestia longiramus]